MRLSNGEALILHTGHHVNDTRGLKYILHGVQIICRIALRGRFAPCPMGAPHDGWAHAADWGRGSYR